MDCLDVRKNLAAAIDGELRDGDLAAIDAHLSTCADCRAERDAVQRLMMATSTRSTWRVSTLPAIRAEIDREIMLGLVDQVSALTAEVKALRAELASMGKPGARTIDVAHEAFDSLAITDSLLRERAGQQLYQAMRIAQDAEGTVDSDLVTAVQSSVRALTTALNSNDAADIKTTLVDLNTSLLELSKAFYAAHSNRDKASVEGSVPRKSPPTSTTASLHERRTGVSDLWSLAIS